MRLPNITDDDIGGLMSCPACPDGYVWDANGPTAKCCPKCNGQGKYVDTRALKKWRRYRRIVLRARLEEPGVPDADGRPVKPSWHVHEALLERARLAEAKAMAVDCDLCFKTGRYVFSESSRARAAGIPRRTWTRTWCDRYAEGLEIPRRWEAIAVGHVRRRLKLDP